MPRSSLGHFLDLAMATPGSVFFDSIQPPEGSENAVRTYGMCPIGGGEAAIEPDYLKGCLEISQPAWRIAAEAGGFG